MAQLLRFVNRNQLVRFRHGLKPSVTTSIPRSQTVTLPQFSTKTYATRLRERSPANDAQPTAFTPPTVCGEEFIHIRDLNIKSLSDSMVQINQPLEADTFVAEAAAAAAAAAAVAAAAAAAPPAPETSVGLECDPGALPEELSRNVIHLSCESTAEGGICDVYVVGIIHEYDTEKSCRQVRAIVDFLKPEAVFLELGRDLVPLLPHEVEEENAKVNLHRAGSGFFAAYEEAIKYGGRVILGDRPLEITFNRIWSQMPLWSQTKAVFYAWFRSDHLFSGTVDLNELEMYDSAPCANFCKKFPTSTKAIVHERDQYMSSKLLEVASESRSVVAVVGRGHLQGIKKNWKQPVVVEDLMTVPSVFSSAIFRATVGVALADVYLLCKLFKK